ncbi:MULTISPECIES: Fe-S cluster assembly sulfur transfer protein SufU [Clostridium]|uniref:Fe-S cluster assembly sulfur transfer protein SufU n=1 Tax=Clostridium TaxID=1485 RepID=UPI000983BFF0|nr:MULTISPECIES: SUF system NifU family Fe-S cluster assembly protein [Clostridium]AQR95780.1 zinc-dependent sulfurtransferase SufU [Clostridium saccharoperbutylacetonicum]NSB31643.1 nitrogen fixation NifU-like protein [Clostridium saccharoperbutylacetonicum]
MDLNAIYTELIMEHSTSKHNKRSLENPDIKEKGHNPSCGDEITLELKLNNDSIEDLAFTGQGCAISQASTSIMIDLIKGKKIDEALMLTETFIGMIKREIKDDEELYALEDAMAFKNISNMPARVKCAVLAWHTLKEALEKKQGS